MLNKHNLNVAKFICKDSSRYNLSAIYVKPEATVATNGHYLVWCSSDSVSSKHFPVVPNFAGAQDTFKPFLLDAAKANEIAKAVPKKSKIENVAVNVEQNELGETQATFAVTDLESPQVFSAKSESGQFPNYDTVVPKWENAKFRIALNAAYLAKIAKAFEQFSEKPSNLVVLSFYGSDEAMRFDGTRNGQGMTAVFDAHPWGRRPTRNIRLGRKRGATESRGTKKKA
jgi:hypothetical protein